MLGLDVLAAGFKAVVRRRSEAGLIALQAFIDAFLNVLGRMVHDVLFLGR